MSAFRHAVNLCLAFAVVAAMAPGAAGATEPSPVAPVETPPPRPTDDTEPPVSGPGLRTLASAEPTPEQLAAAMDIPADLLVSASIGSSDPRAFAISDGVPIVPEAPTDPDPDDPVPTATLSATAAAAADDASLPFPSRGDSFLVMSTGDASYAMYPTDYAAGMYLDGSDNELGTDLARLELVLRAPDEARCLALDVAFLSEEYPEWVGTSYNDAFTVQAYNTDMSIENGAVVAPGNFAQDSQGRPLSVNASFDLTASTATAYDGATPRLRAATPVLGGQEVSLNLTIQDLGDSALDSAAFVDNLFFSTDTLCRFGSTEDTDGDGLLDEWETDGFAMAVDGAQYFVDLPAMGADPRVRDIFVEIDYMAETGHSHQPKPDNIAAVVASFAARNIHLHVDYGPNAPLTSDPAGPTWGDLSQANAIAHSEYFGSKGSGSDSYSWRAFDDVKADNFDPARAALFHYNLWVHYMEDSGKHPSGRSRGVLEGGSDFIVSLGDWSNRSGAESGTFMHELGHNLGLGHGGSDHVNRKPNYISVMNYDFQYGMMRGYPGAPFDYSFVELPALDEHDLDENLGIGITPDLGLDTRYHCASDGKRLPSASQPIDWDCDGFLESSAATSINDDDAWDVLEGQNDWTSLVFTGGAIGMPGAIVDLPEETVDPEPEATYETYLEVVGGAPVVESVPILADGPFRVGDEVTASLPFGVTAGDGGNMTAEWSWGDGATTAGTIAAGTTPVATGVHAYAQPGTYDVQVLLTGPDGTAMSATTTVTVEAAASSGSATALGWQTLSTAGQRGRVYVALDTRAVPFGSGRVGASLVHRPDAGLTVIGGTPESVAVVGRTAVVDSLVSVNGRAGFRQRVTLVEGWPARARIQVWDPARGGPGDTAARVLDTAPGGQPTSVPAMLVDVRG